MMEEEEVSWEVDKILDHRGEEGQRFYKVKWKGRYQPLWEPAEMFDTTGCIVDYWDELKRAGGGKGGGEREGEGFFFFFLFVWGEGEVIFSETNK